MRYTFVEAEKANYTVQMLCELLRVSRAGYYAWRGRKPSARALENEQLVQEIRRIRATPDGRFYGSPRMTSFLNQRGIAVGENRVARLMKRHGLYASEPHSFVRTTIAGDVPSGFPDLVERQFKAARPNQLWVSDITYIPTQQGWLYLAVVVDVYSRAVVGWALSPRIDAALVADALRMALARRNGTAGVILHSDRGSQYTSRLVASLCLEHGIRQSMGRRGDCYDNALAESFFSILKREAVSNWGKLNRADMRSRLLLWIEATYNRTRIHSALGFLAPLQFEAQAA